MKLFPNMHPSRILPFLLCTLSIGVLLAAASRSAAEGETAVIVKGVLGRAQFSRGGAASAPLGPNMVLKQGDIIQTASGSALDLDLGQGPGVLRLTQNTAAVLDRLSSTNGNTQIQISLRAGELLGLTKPLSQDSRLEIKVTTGMARILEGRFRVDARGNVVVTQGKVLFAHVPASGDPSAHTLSAPPAVYFTPTEGVHPAPKDLEREVFNQMRSTLPRR